MSLTLAQRSLAATARAGDDDEAFAESFATDTTPIEALTVTFTFDHLTDPDSAEAAYALLLTFVTILVEDGTYAEGTVGIEELT